MRTIAIAIALYLAACGGTTLRRRRPIPNRRPLLLDKENADKEPALTKREVDQQLDDIERQIESGDENERFVVAE